MKLKFLLTLAVFTLASTITAAPVITKAAPAAATEVATEKSVLSRAVALVTELPSNVKNSYNDVVNSDFVKNHQVAIAVVATAVIASGITCYVMRKANKNKQK